MIKIVIQPPYIPDLVTIGEPTPPVVTIELDYNANEFQTLLPHLPKLIRPLLTRTTLHVGEELQ